ncbi:YfjI family protein [Sandarakinorhabdus sp.]|uniref:YfjI family protein n=1 Tax=Sandarakinorhabdus sp. TaxID=1916663 RepID=UPI003F71EB97
MHAQETPFEPVWPEPASRFLRASVPPAPRLPLAETLGPGLSRWVVEAADAKGAPPDYVLGGLLSVAGATIGNARWVRVWDGWEEPPIVWTMCVGLPSAGKSPALDAVIQPLRKLERPLRAKAKDDLAAWKERAEVAALAEKEWKASVTAAIKAGDTHPVRPANCEAGQKPHEPRLIVTDCTIEALAVIIDRQPRGPLQCRDEIAGWLEGMSRYSAGSDRPFWLEAWGGRGFTVERIGREPLTIDRLTVGVVGSIQPDRLKSLLFKADDDGLLARFMPIWPNPVALKRPGRWTDEALLERTLERLLKLDLMTDEHGGHKPMFVPLTADAQALMDDFRLAVRGWEDEAEGLLLSFIGKLPGLAARLSLVLACLDWAAEDGQLPHEVDADHFKRAAELVGNYVLPMARRAYADAAVPQAERSARRLVATIRKMGWESFTTRQAMKLERAGLATAAELDPALSLLEDADCIRSVEQPAKPQGGRPSRLFIVNPALLAKG